MAITLKESPFESEMAIAPPLVCGMTPLGTAVSSHRRPLWGMSRYFGTTRKLQLLQIVLEDMALVARVRPLPGISGDNVHAEGLGGNDKVIWVTTTREERDPAGVYSLFGKLYKIDPRTFRVRQSVTTPARIADRNRPKDVGGDDHTVWIYSREPHLTDGTTSIYKLSVPTLVVQQRKDFSGEPFGSLNGDRHGFWVLKKVNDILRLQYFDANMINRLNVPSPLWQSGARIVHDVVGVGGKDPDTGRDRALVFLTYKASEKWRLHLVDASTRLRLRSTAISQVGRYSALRIAG